MYWGIFTFVTLLGLCIGSFLNVVIHRLPRRESIVLPGSRCPRCLKPLSPLDNIPILSYIMLHGKCRTCCAAISMRYPLVEALTALLFALCYVRYGFTLAFFLSCILCALMVACAFIDWEHQLVMDSLIVAGFIVALPVNGFFSALCGWREMLLGIVCGAGPLLLIALIGRLISKRPVMGGGDIKLMGMAGAFLGWKMALLSFVFASVAGGLVLAALLALGKVKRNQEVPFVPMLAFGVTVALLVGQPLLDWYLALFML